MFRVGCPMWAHRPWVGKWYPQTTRPGTELSFYAKLCNAVEGNTTFYAEPSAENVQRWHDQTPSDFRFLFKLAREITHDRRLNDGPYWSVVNRVLSAGFLFRCKHQARCNRKATYESSDVAHGRYLLG